MIYAENVFVCIAAPLVVALFLVRGETRRFVIFFILGLFCCLLAAYINSFFTAALGMAPTEAAVKIIPLCEEVIKALPVFFYMAVFLPARGRIAPAALAIGLGFATLENCCLITQYGASDLLFALVRGFAAGAMHAVCAALLGWGLARMVGQRHLLVPGAFGLVCVTSVYHAIYNLLVTDTIGWRAAGYLLPVATAAVMALFFVKEKRPADDAER